jgi:DNA gyrase subunit A
VNLCLVTPNDQFMCITNGGQVIRTEVSQVRETGRNTQGVRVMMLEESERVVDVAKLAEEEDDARGERTAEPAGIEPADADGVDDVADASDDGSEPEDGES